jgi:hypothetical protein
MKTNLNPQVILKDPEGCTLLIQSSTQNASISVPKMIQWDKLTLPNERLLENVSKPVATTSSSGRKRKYREKIADNNAYD